MFRYPVNEPDPSTYSRTVSGQCVRFTVGSMHRSKTHDSIELIFLMNQDAISIVVGSSRKSRADIAELVKEESARSI